jgi:hypothetical protein
MRTALLAELRFLVASYEYRASRMEAASGSFDVSVHTATEVYDRMLDKIGLLTVDQAHNVIHAYLGAKHLPFNLRQQARREGDNPDFVRVIRNDIGIAIKLHRERIDLFKNAIDALRD